MYNDIPTPGSKKAKAMGCHCPVLDNAHGKGYMGIKGLFVYNENCPIHNQDYRLYMEPELREEPESPLAMDGHPLHGDEMDAEEGRLDFPH